MEEKPSRIKCFVCRQDRQEGLTLLGEYICAQCEQEIVRTKVNHPQYEYYKDRLKKLWGVTWLSGNYPVNSSR